MAVRNGSARVQVHNEYGWDLNVKRKPTVIILPPYVVDDVHQLGRHISVQDIAIHTNDRSNCFQNQRESFLRRLCKEGNEIRYDP